MQARIQAYRLSPVPATVPPTIRSPFIGSYGVTSNHYAYGFPQHSPGCLLHTVSSLNQPGSNDDGITSPADALNYPNSSASSHWDDRYSVSYSSGSSAVHLAVTLSAGMPPPGLSAPTVIPPATTQCTVNSILYWQSSYWWTILIGLNLATPPLCHSFPTLSIKTAFLTPLSRLLVFQTCTQIFSLVH